MTAPQDPSRLPDPADQVEWALLGLENQRRMRVTLSRTLAFYASDRPSCTPSPAELEAIRDWLKRITAEPPVQGRVDRQDEWMYVGCEVRSPWEPQEERSLLDEPLFSSPLDRDIVSYRVHSGWVTELDRASGQVRHWVDKERSFETYLLGIHYRVAQENGDAELVLDHLQHSALLGTIDPEGASRRDSKPAACRRPWRRK